MPVDLEQYGYIGIVVFLILTGCGLWLPEEVALIAAGIMAAQGILNPWLAIVACLVGCLLGDSVMYFIGYKLGRRLLKPGSFWGKCITPEREKMFEKLIHRHGKKVLFFARFLVGVRSPVYLTAGILKYPFRKFIVTDFFCALFVVLLFVGLSFWWGNDIVDYIRKVEHGLTVVLAIAAVPVIIFLILHFRRKNKSTSPGALGALLGEDADSIKNDSGTSITETDASQ